MTSRLKLLRNELGITQDVLANRMGITKSAVSMIETGKAALSERNKNIIVQEFNVNSEWLDTGEGLMFDPIAAVNPLKESPGRIYPTQSVPVYDIKATAGLVPLFADRFAHAPVDYIHIPNLPKCDGAVYVVGDSMYPLLKSGDIVLYKQVNDIENNIFWGEMYLLSVDAEGEEYIMVKYIQKSDRPGYVKLVSQNKYHADKDVEISRIRALAIIKASIRMNAMK